MIQNSKRNERKIKRKSLKTWETFRKLTFIQKRGSAQNKKETNGEVGTEAEKRKIRG